MLENLLEILFRQMQKEILSLIQINLFHVNKMASLMNKSKVGKELGHLFTPAKKAIEMVLSTFKVDY